MPHVRAPDRRAEGEPSSTGPVVVGITGDGSDQERALEVSVEWAARRQRTLRILSGADADSHIQASEMDLDRRRHLVDQVATTGKLGHQVLVASPRIERVVSSLPAVEALIEESRSASLIVLQRRRLGRFARLYEGSVTARVAARASCPVLVVHPDDADLTPRRTASPGPVLVAVDGRGHSRHAVRQAFSEASWLRVPLMAVTVWQPPVEGVIPPSSLEVEWARTSAAKALAEQLAGYGADYPDVEIRRSLVCADVTPGLIEASEGAALLVVARHAGGRGGVRNLGGIVEQLIDRAACPMLVTATDRPLPRGDRSSTDR